MRDDMRENNYDNTDQDALRQKSRFFSENQKL